MTTLLTSLNVEAKPEPVKPVRAADTTSKPHKPTTATQEHIAGGDVALGSSLGSGRGFENYL